MQHNAILSLEYNAKKNSHLIWYSYMYYVYFMLGLFMVNRNGIYLQIVKVLCDKMNIVNRIVK